MSRGIGSESRGARPWTRHCGAEIVTRRSLLRVEQAVVDPSTNPRDRSCPRRARHPIDPIDPCRSRSRIELRVHRLFSGLPGTRATPSCVARCCRRSKDWVGLDHQAPVGHGATACDRSMETPRREAGLQHQLRNTSPTCAGAVFRVGKHRPPLPRFRAGSVPALRRCAWTRGPKPSR